MKPYWIVLIVVGSLLVLALILGLIGYFACFYNNKKDISAIDRLKTADYGDLYSMIEAGVRFAVEHEKEIVHIKAKDGKTLTGYFYEQNQDQPILLEFHGYKDNSFFDLGCGLSYDFKEGFNIFLCDHRGHGGSDGRTISFGIKEKDDVITWANYLAKRFPGRTILLYGISMGAASVLMASSADLPKEIVGIVADCPYSSVKAITTETAKKMGLPPFISYPILWLGAFLYGHFRMDKTSPLKEVKKTTRPIYLIHGLADNYVSVEHSKRIYAANPDKITLSLYEGARHGLSFCVDPYRYIDEIKNFIRSIEEK